MTALNLPDTASTGATVTVVIDLQRLAQRLTVEQRRPLADPDVHNWLKQAGFSLVPSAQGRRWSCGVERLSALQPSEVLERSFVQEIGGVKLRRTEILDASVVGGSPRRVLARIDLQKFAARVSPPMAGVLHSDQEAALRLLSAAGAVQRGDDGQLWDIPQALLAVLHPGEYSMVEGTSD